MSRRAAVAGIGAAAAASAAVAAGVVQTRRWRTAGDPGATGRSLPTDVVHHTVQVGDGGTIHAVERGRGPALVLVHGVTLGVGTWAPQLRHLADRHRVIAVDQRGHGSSTAGHQGMSLERLALDLGEVLETLDVRDAVVVGHSMGGMVTQLLALDRPLELAARVRGLVLLNTAGGGLVPGPSGASAAVVAALSSGAGRGLRRADRLGAGLLPGRDAGAWITRASFGAHPDPADLELARSLIHAMSPAAMSELVGPLLAFDVLDRIHGIELPTLVVVGARDLLTPPRQARAMASRIPGAELVVLPGCGHMTMLERPHELAAIVSGFSDRVREAP